MRWGLFHPRDGKLHRWLDGADDPPVIRHLATCERCADRLERFADQHDQALRNALVATLAPPADLAGRLADQVDERQRQSSMRNVLLDAVGAGVDTLRLLIDEDPPDG